MKIIIDCRILFRNYFTMEFSRYITGALVSLKKQKPHVEFRFLADKLPDKKMYSGLAKEDFIIKKCLPGLAGLKIWQGWILPAILKKTAADAVIMTGGIASSEITSMDIPQLLWIIEAKKKNSKKKYFDRIKKGLPKTLQCSTVLFTDSDENKTKWIHDYHFIHNKIIVIPPAFDQTYLPISWAEKEEVKKVYASGREFFLVDQTNGSGSELIILLKAFSRFKKQQKSNMQLLIVGINRKRDKKLSRKLDAFKYRADMHVYDEPEETETKKILGAAYALFQVHISSSALLRAHSMGVPVIINSDGFSKEIAGHALLAADFTDHEQIANRMALVFKDEVLRNEMIKNGETRARQFSPEHQTLQLWNTIEQNVK